MCQSVYHSTPDKIATPISADEQQKINQIVADMTEIYGAFDLSRIPPKLFLPQENAREAYREELIGIMRNDINGIPVGRVVNVRSPEYAHVSRLRSTTI